MIKNSYYSNTMTTSVFLVFHASIMYDQTEWRSEGVV